MAEPIPKRHVVAIPYPGRGHINPMLNFCNTVLTHEPNDILISFIVTQEWLGLITSSISSKQAPLPKNLSFQTIPNNVMPSEIGRGKDFKGFFETALTKMQRPVEDVLDRLPRASVIVYDTFLKWAVETGTRRGVPLASFWTQSALMFSIFHHWEVLLQNRVSVNDEEMVMSNIPGVPSMNYFTDFPLLHGRGEQVLQQALEAVELTSKARYLLFTTAYELEARAIDHLQQVLSRRIYSTGLAIAPQGNDVENSQAKPDYIEWLDAQPARSVLYISQGSFLSVSNAQLDEIVSGIRDSRVRFLWVSRGDFENRDGSWVDDRRGLVVRWCDQLRVLSHVSVGGFWSHCGWNSTKEGAFCGVPMLTYPLLWDQPTNCKMIVDEWKMGLRVRRMSPGGGEGFVKREEIEALVRRIMDQDSDEGKERRRRAEDIEGICKKAACGSSEAAVVAFVRDLINKKNEDGGISHVQ